MSVRIRLNRSGVRALLQSSEVQADLERRANNVRNGLELRDEYEVTTATGKTRARASVITAGPHARNREAKRKTLLIALSRGRS